MDTQAKTEKRGIWNIFDRIQGDKVIWIVFILLILYSLVSNFSATSLKATLYRSRMDIFLQHIVFVAVSFAIVFFFYFVTKVGVLRFFSQFGFVCSFVLLVLLMVWKSHVVVEDSAARSIRIFGFDLQVYEFVKVFMVMYLSWAVHAYKNNSLRFVNMLSSNFKSLSFLGKPVWKRIIYIHLPIIIVTAFIMRSGFSSALFTATIMIVTVLIGGIPKKDILALIILVAAAVLLSFTAWKITGSDSIGRRWETVESRITAWAHPKKLSDFEPGSLERKAYIDDHRQAKGALIAIKEGGFFGKGPGRSTQKYSIAEMYGDYVFSFIVEEYGILFGALPLLALYVCLVGRGAIISRYCTNDFCKTTVAGLTLLISGQALLHMFVNVGLFPLTGQTLPLVSYGRSSLIAFSCAFGILLAISKIAKKQVDEAEAAAAPLVDRSDDDLHAGLNDLEEFETDID